MFLIAGPDLEFRQLLQVLCWIVLSVSVFVILLTVLLHYRKKRSGAEHPAGEEDALPDDTAEQMGFTRGDGEYVLFDHSPLIREYKNKLCYHHARYSALSRDFEELKSKYDANCEELKTHANNLQAIQEREELSASLRSTQQELADLTAIYESGRQDLLQRIAEETDKNRELDEKNKSLVEDLDRLAGERMEPVIPVESVEILSLKEKLGELDCLKDLLQEKNTQVEFLQSQLEQRIRNFHQVDQQLAQVKNDLEESRQSESSLRHTMNQWEIELQQKNEWAAGLQHALDEKQDEVSQKGQLLESLQERISALEAELGESAKRNEELMAQLNRNESSIGSLEDLLGAERGKCQLMEKKLESRTIALRHLHDEISSLMKEEQVQAAVLSMRPEYRVEQKEAVLH